MIAASGVIVVAGLREVRAIAVPFLIALFLCVLSVPLLMWLIRHRVPRPLAVAATVLANVAAVGALLLLVGTSVNALAGSLPRYQARAEAWSSSAFGWLEERGVDTSELAWLHSGSTDAPTVDLDGRGGESGEPDADDVADSAATQGELIGIGALVEVVGSTVRGIASLVTLTLMIFLIMVFVLAEAPVLPRKLENAFGWRMEEFGRWDKARREIQRYLVIKTLVSLATGLLVGLWTWALGVDYALLWGVIAFALNYVPSVGSIVAAVPAMILALIDAGAATALGVGAGYLVVNVSLGNFLEPHLLGRRLGMSTLVIILSLLFWGWLWGPLGMLLSVPLTMVLRIVLENTDDFRWVAQLIAARPLPPPSTRTSDPRARPRADDDTPTGAVEAAG